MTYAEKLKDPRWQKRRLEILQRDNWQCTACGASERTLHVHHEYYVSGRDIWEYPSSSLRTVCDECHKECKLNSHSRSGWELLAGLECKGWPCSDDGKNDIAFVIANAEFEKKLVKGEAARLIFFLFTNQDVLEDIRSKMGKPDEVLS